MATLRLSTGLRSSPAPCPPHPAPPGPWGRGRGPRQSRRPHEWEPQLGAEPREPGGGAFHAPVHGAGRGFRLTPAAPTQDSGRTETPACPAPPSRAEWRAASGERLTCGWGRKRKHTLAFSDPPSWKMTVRAGHWARREPSWRAGSHFVFSFKSNSNGSFRVKRPRSLHHRKAPGVDRPSASPLRQVTCRPGSSSPPGRRVLPRKSLGARGKDVPPRRRPRGLGDLGAGPHGRGKRGGDGPHRVCQAGAPVSDLKKSDHSPLSTLSGYFDSLFP